MMRRKKLPSFSGIRTELFNLFFWPCTFFNHPAFRSQRVQNWREKLPVLLGNFFFQVWGDLFSKGIIEKVLPSPSSTPRKSKRRKLSPPPFSLAVYLSLFYPITQHTLQRVFYRVFRGAKEKSKQNRSFNSATNFETEFCWLSSSPGSKKKVQPLASWERNWDSSREKLKIVICITFTTLKW